MSDVILFCKDLHTMSFKIDTPTYLAEVENVWLQIEERIEDLGLDVDCFRNGSVFTIEDGQKRQIIINRQEPKYELWLASILGAHHYYFDGKQWVATTDHQTSFWKHLDVAMTALDEDGNIFKDFY